MRRQVFISYRRDDDAGDAGRLYDRLQQRFHVFFDVKSIKLAEDFPTAIDRAVNRCDALVVVIGRHWMAGTTDDPNDFVRIEVAAALERAIPTFPVLVDGAIMPERSQLPPSLAALSNRHALEVSRSRFDYDVGLLIAAIEEVPRRHQQVPRWAKVAIPAAAGLAVITGSALAVNAIGGPSTPPTTVEVTTTRPPATTTTTRPPGSTTTSATTTTTTIQVTVPNVVGMTSANARSTLESAGLRVTQQNEFSSATAGRVIRTSPAAGTRVARGSTVTVTVALSPPVLTR